MPIMKKNALIAVQVPNLPTGEHTDGQGLVLRVSENGRRHWVLRTRFQGKAKNIGLGGRFPGTTLKQARKDAVEARRMIADGHDPVSRRVEVQEANRVPFFIEAALRYLELNRPSWRNAKHAAQWENDLETYAFPAIGDKPVDEITSNDVMELLEAIWHDEAGNRRPSAAEAIRHIRLLHGAGLVQPAIRPVHPSCGCCQRRSQQ